MARRVTLTQDLPITDDKKKKSEEESEMSKIRLRRRSRVHEKDEFFRKIEDRLEHIKLSTDSYKKQQSDEFFNRLKVSTKNSLSNIAHNKLSKY